MAQKLYENLDNRFENVNYLMDKYDWDMFTAVFGETDWAQHFFWRFHDPDHPDYNPEEARKYGDTILRVYQKADEITRKVMEKYPEATVIIVSDHGGALNTKGEELLASWLEALGLLSYEKKGWKNPVKICKRFA